MKKPALAIFTAILVGFGITADVFAQGQSSDPFCTNLQAMIRAGASGFRSIRGAPDPDASGHGWASRISLPGAQECEVWADESGPSISCDFSSAASVNDLEALYDEVAEKIGDCLKGWTKSRETTRRGLVKGTEFERGDITVRIEIKERHSTRHPGFFLDMWIDKSTN